jgi:ATP phosphoribosyltransferase
MEKVKFAIPAGSLAKATFEILQRSGYKVSGQERTYRPSINDPQIELKILRPQEIPVFVSEGLQDVGITGQDWIKETHADVDVIQNLEYGRIRLVVAVPKALSKNSIGEIMESLWNKGKNFRVSPNT